MRFNVLASKFNWRSHSPFPSWRSKILYPFSNLPVSIFSAPLQAFLVLESPNLHHHPSSCEGSYSSVHLSTHHPPTSASQLSNIWPSKRSDNNSPLSWWVELRWLLDFCGVAFRAEIAWSSLACNHDFYYLYRIQRSSWWFPHKNEGHLFFPYELFLWSPSYGFSVPSISSVKNSPLQEIWAHSDEPFMRWTKNTKTYRQAPSQSLSIKFSTYSRYTYPYPCQKPNHQVPRYPPAALQPTMRFLPKPRPPPHQLATRC